MKHLLHTGSLALVSMSYNSFTLTSDLMSLHKPYRPRQDYQSLTNAGFIHRKQLYGDLVYFCPNKTK